MDSVKSKLLRILFLTVLTNAQIITDNEAKERSMSEIADDLVQLLGVNVENNVRFKELKEKLNKVNNYVIDKDKYAELLSEQTIDKNFNATSFYDALNQPDSFQYLAEEKPKNLYLKMKERMTRDDVEKIIEENNLKIRMKSARKLGEDASSDVEDVDRVIDETVDKIIADAPEDNHKFKVEDLDNTKWDPEPELRHRVEGASGRRLYQGERCTVRDYPFMVAIQMMGRFWCGGAIYERDLVLTSASCLQLLHNNRFYRENPRVLQVRVGSNHSRLGGELVDALEVYFHPSYNPRTLANNIAVIRLRMHLKINYHRIPKIIAISDQDQTPSYTSSVLVLGWGVTRMTQKLNFEPVFLQRKLLPVYPSVFCKEAYGDKFISEHMFCAGTMSTGEGACDHDAGGPAILNGKLVGIISYGPTSCGFKNAPTVFTLVGAFADWIETVNETRPEYYTIMKSTTERPDHDWYRPRTTEDYYNKKKKKNKKKLRAHATKDKHLITPFNRRPTQRVQTTPSEWTILDDPTTEEIITERPVMKVEPPVTEAQRPFMLWKPEVRATERTLRSEQHNNAREEAMNRIRKRKRRL